MLRAELIEQRYNFEYETFFQLCNYTDCGFLENQAQVNSGGTAKSHSYLYDQTSSSIYYGTLTSSQVNGGTAKAITIGASSWSVDGVSYGLDALGRVISKGPKNFVYGVNGRIKEAKNGTTSLAQYFYDEEDNPVLKEIVGGGIEIYLGDNIYATGAFLEPVKIGNRVVGYFKDGSFVSSSQDHLNTSVLDESGGVNLVSPFGERASRSEVSFILDFTLKGFDSDIDAVRMGRRFYDSGGKRFLVPDSYFLEKFEKVLGSPIEGGLYSYVSNDPINKLDPTGDCMSCLFVNVAKLGHHELRQSLNTPLPKNSSEARSRGFELQAEEAAVFHQNGIGINEEKFVSKDGREAIYDGGTKGLVNDAQIKGSFNFIAFSKPENGKTDIGGAFRAIGHAVIDVLPWVAFGNDRADPSTIGERLSDTIDGAQGIKEGGNLLESK